MGDYLVVGVHSDSKYLSIWLLEFTQLVSTFLFGCWSSLR